MSIPAASAMKMTRMKSYVKKWQSLSKVGKVHTYYGSYDMDMENDDTDMETCNVDNANSAAASSSFSQGGRGSTVPEGFSVVFVGKARRRYAVHARLLQHPLFKALQQRSETSGINQSLGITLGCEVVLFEHMLWMLESDDPALQSTDSIHELAELYMPSDGSSISMLHLLRHEN
ncbi:hypothetical protein GOP47_0008914 [Adiantum capillus-veneris]|uniref:Uncharacterized protein n=1 Tax=Adiantum capillus-veneris TaxID=13818 RepID=A0A9D4UZH1_ADICA|nr:hypothetical protein GOP47_0008914 [Adiantum capillus-veneris]